MLIIAPSLLAADAGRLNEEIQAVEAACAEYLHIDVMDGRFVPNLSFGPALIADIRKASRLYFDVHLMIDAPDKYVQAFIDAGADSITIHMEAERDLHKICNLCRKNAVGFGLALCPETPVELPEELMNSLDILLIMSIHPGFGGQQFMPEAFARIRQARELRKEHGARYLISVDGGVNADNASQIAAAGADILVAGSAVFGQMDRSVAINMLRSGGNQHVGI